MYCLQSTAVQTAYCMLPEQRYILPEQKTIITTSPKSTTCKLLSPNDNIVPMAAIKYLVIMIFNYSLLNNNHFVHIRYDIICLYFIPTVVHFIFLTYNRSNCSSFYFINCKAPIEMSIYFVLKFSSNQGSVTVRFTSPIMRGHDIVFVIPSLSEKYSLPKTYTAKVCRCTQNEKVMFSYDLRNIK